MVGLDFGTFGLDGGFEIEGAGDAYPLLDCGVGTFDIFATRMSGRTCYVLCLWEEYLEIT